MRDVWPKQADTQEEDDLKKDICKMTILNYVKECPVSEGFKNMFVY